MNNTTTNMAAAALNTYEDIDDELTIRMEAHNDELINNLRSLNHRQYFQESRTRCFPEVKLEFMEYFLTLTTNRRKFIVPGDKLREYGVINTNRSNHILRCLEQYGFVEGEDYVLMPNVGQQTGRGGTNRMTYMLTKKALKLGLMRAKNSIEYANYYYLLEQVTGLYYEYLDRYNTKLLTIKDDKIDRLQATVDDQTARINQLLSRTDHIIEQNDDLLIDNQYLNDKVDELKDDVEEIKDAFRDTLEDRNPRPEEAPLQHYFVLLRCKDEPNSFRYIKAQSRHVDKELAKYEATHDVVISKRYNANPVDMYSRFKKSVKDEVKTLRKEIRKMKLSREEKIEKLEDLYENPPISFKYNDITICPEKITEEELIARIDDCDLERNDVPVAL